MLGQMPRMNSLHIDIDDRLALRSFLLLRDNVIVHGMSDGETAVFIASLDLIPIPASTLPGMVPAPGFRGLPAGCSGPFGNGVAGWRAA